METIEKANKDKAKLTRKVITNKLGHKQTVWVTTGAKETGKKNLKAMHQVGDEGMFMGGEFKILSESFNSYTVQELDEEGKFKGKPDTVNKKDFESRFTKFPTQLADDTKGGAEGGSKDTKGEADSGKTMERMESETSLMPDVMASSISGQALREQHEPMIKEWDTATPDRKKEINSKINGEINQLTQYLTKRAVGLYGSNENFRKKTKRDSGRDYLWALMENWSKATSNPTVYQAKLKEVGINKAFDNLIRKAVYVNSAENRKKGRVGKQYGGEKTSSKQKKTKKPEKEKKYWMGHVPDTDDFKSKITDTFIDGKTVFGSWANMTPQSYSQYGVGRLGIGYGQKYKKQSDGKWLKVG